MQDERLNRVLIAADIVLDGRLALFHERDRWLAVADVHFGYELSQRAAGNLFPLWGMQTIQERLCELLTDYRPAHLILLGDLVHDRTAINALTELVRELEGKTNVILIAGNHDRHISKLMMMSVRFSVGGDVQKPGDSLIFFGKRIDQTIGKRFSIM